MREEVDKATRFLRSFDKPKVRHTLPPEYVERIDALLEGGSLRPTGKRTLDKLAKLRAFVTQRTAAGEIYTCFSGKKRWTVKLHEPRGILVVKRSMRCGPLFAS